MKAAIKSNYTNSFLLARFRHDRIVTNGATRGKFLVEIINAVNTVGGINGERNAIQTEEANNAGETLRMIRFSSGTQDAIENRFGANAAFL